MAVLEICIDSVASGIEAEDGGAERVELCDNLVDGGTTPSIGKVLMCLKYLKKVQLFVLVRPRGGELDLLVSL